MKMIAKLRMMISGLALILNAGWKLHKAAVMAFDAVGLPGFQFVQDYIDYFSRTHHSNMRPGLPAARSSQAI